MSIKFKKQIGYQIERYPTTCKECPAYYETPYVCHNERGWEGHCKLGYFSNCCDMRDYNSNQLHVGCRIKEDPRVALMPEEAAKPCGFCHANEDGEYDMFAFEHPADPQRSAKLSFYDRVLAVEINQPGDEKTQRLSCKINHCPFCGRAYGEEET